MPRWSVTVREASRGSSRSNCTIARWASGQAEPKSCSAEEFAESVVEDVVGRGKGGILWKGPNSGAVKLVSKWVPVSMLVST
jgi:hypothetical protein